MNSVQQAINSKEDMASVLNTLHANVDLYRGGYLTVERAQFEGETNRITLEITMISHPQ